MPQTNHKASFWQAAKRNWMDCFLITIVLAMLVWIGFLVQGSDPNKASWLLLPLTAIYVVTNIWVAAGAVRSANAASETANITQQTLREMQRQTQAMYAPTISFPEDYKCWLKPDGTMELLLTNLAEQPALRLQIFVWEMEADQAGLKKCKFSSLRESLPEDFLGDAQGRKFVLKPSKRMDSEKVKFADVALERFQEVYGKVPDGSLCALQYSTKVSNGPILLVNDLMIVQPSEEEKHHD